MALLQISEPDESTAPHQHRVAAGIDLGTTNSLVATVKRPESMRIIEMVRNNIGISLTMD